MDVERDSRPPNYDTFADQYEEGNQQSRAAAHGVNASTETGKGIARATGSIAASALYQNGQRTGSASASSAHGNIVTEVVDDDEEESTGLRSRTWVSPGNCPYRLSVQTVEFCWRASEFCGRCRVRSCNFFSSYKSNGQTPSSEIDPFCCCYCCCNCFCCRCVFACCGGVGFGCCENFLGCVAKCCSWLCLRKKSENVCKHRKKGWP